VLRVQREGTGLVVVGQAQQLEPGSRVQVGAFRRRVVPIVGSVVGSIVNAGSRGSITNWKSP
jgi:F0F1-type ATP synthase alpha subunit